LVTRLIHRIWSGVGGNAPPMNDVANTATARPAFDDKRKKMNFWMLR
jgi:hypothetical protein